MPTMTPAISLQSEFSLKVVTKRRGPWCITIALVRSSRAWKTRSSAPSIGNWTRNSRRPFDWKRTQGSQPKSPWQSLAMLETTPNLRVDLVVSEPLIQDPVAIDLGAIRN